MCVCVCVKGSEIYSLLYNPVSKLTCLLPSSLSKAVIFVVDSTDRDRVPISLKAFNRMLAHPV